MKKISLLLLLLPLKIFSQTDSIPKNAEGKYEYTAVVKVDSASADKLYSNAKKFIALSFNSGKAVTQLNDDNSKTVIGHGISEFSIKVVLGASQITDIKFTIIIQCKDDRYKYSMSDFEYTNPAAGVDGIALEESSYWKGKAYHKWFNKMSGGLDTQMKALIIKLQEYMTSKSKATQDF